MSTDRNHGGPALAWLASAFTGREPHESTEERPLRSAMARVIALSGAGAVMEALGEVVKARRNTPFDGGGLSSDEALALAETWEFQAAHNLSQGRLECGLENLAIAEQILESRPEHHAHRRRIRAEIALRIPSAHLRTDYLANVRHR